MQDKRLEKQKDSDSQNKEIMSGGQTCADPVQTKMITSMSNSIANAFQNVSE